MKSALLKALPIYGLFLSTQLCASSIQVQLSGKMPQSDVVSDIYGKLHKEYAIEVSQNLAEPIELWARLGYSQEKGYSLGLEESTTLTLIPLSAGVSWSFKAGERFEPYVGVGLSYSQLKFHDDSAYVKPSLTDWGLGAVLKIGSRYRLDERYFVSGFIGYDYQKFKFEGDDGVTCYRVNVSGFSMGFGLGIYF